MIKSILVPATGQVSDAVVWSAALALAQTFSAHLEVLHIRVDPVEVAMMISSSDGAGGTVLQGVIDSLTRAADETEAKARAAFSDFCEREKLPVRAAAAAGMAGPSAELHVENGQEVRWLTAYGLTNDLLVAGRGPSGDDAAARSILETLLLESGRPLFIAGSAAVPPQLGERIAVAWKATPQAARAIAFAMPLLARARQVAVLTVEEDEGRPDDAARLTAYLAWQGINATFERLSAGPSGAAETLLAAATERADLLVMGGYGRSRLREWVFGGFTDTVLTDSPLPVLMAH